MTKRQRLLASLAGSNEQARGDEQKLPRDIDESKRSEMVPVLVPRWAVTTESRAEIITQKNSLVTVGQPPRHFLATLHLPDFDVPVIKMGKLRGVEREPYLAWLRTHAVTKPQAPVVPDVELDDIERALVACGGRARR